MPANIFFYLTLTTTWKGRHYCTYMRTLGWVAPKLLNDGARTPAKVCQLLNASNHYAILYDLLGSRQAKGAYASTVSPG